MKPLMALKASTSDARLDGADRLPFRERAVERQGMDGAAERIRRVLRSWRGVSLSEHPAGGTVFEVKGQEVGQILSNVLVGITFTAGLVDELMVSGEVDSADVSDDNHGRLVVRLCRPSDISHAISLLERSYWEILMIDELKEQLTLPVAVNASRGEPE